MEMNTIYIFPMGSTAYFTYNDKVYCGKITQYKLTCYDPGDRYGSYLISYSKYIKDPNVVNQDTWVGTNEVTLTKEEAEVLLYRKQIKRCEDDIKFCKGQIDDYTNKIEKKKSEIHDLQNKLYNIIDK